MTTTITSRVSGEITAEITSRVPSAITAEITDRVSGVITADNTKRVATSGAEAAIPPVYSNDTWGGTWGTTWGVTWYNATLEIAEVAASPAVDVTKRIDETAIENITKRVAGI